MNLNLTWMESEWAQALGWTFVHSIWQIALIGLALFIVLRYIPKRKANLRYTLSTLALWLIVCTTLSTFLVMLPGKGTILETAGEYIFVQGSTTLSFSDQISAWIERHLPVMLTVWAGGVAILMIRLLFSLSWVRHIRKSTKHEPAIQDALNAIVERLKLKIKPEAGSSPFVSSPVTIGHLKPLVLFPIGILNQLSPADVEAILTHELAHIVRKDYLSNLVQSFIETLFYYHPITWWISAVVRSERENRADDLAIAWCGDHLGYAKALMTVQEIQVTQGPSLAIGFASRKGAMLARIKRILNVPYKNHNQMEKTVLLSLTTLCFLAFSLTSHTTTDKPSKDEVTVVTDIILTEAVADSIPAKGTYRLHKKTEEQDISVEVEDGAIKQLKVDGEEVEPAEYGRYDIVVNELFGNIRAPKSAHEFHFEMPDVPAALYEYDFDFEMPPMPAMPELPEMPEFEYFMDGNAFILDGAPTGDIKVITRGADGDNEEIIIMINGDTTIHEIKSGNYFKMNDDYFKEYKLQWEENAEEWKEMGERYREAMRIERDAARDRDDEIRYEIRSRNKELEEAEKMLQYDIRRQQGDVERSQRIIEEMYELESTSPELFQLRSHRLSLSEEMVNDGLVEPGEEIEIQLTPDKLKINGKKMPDEVHQKYLEMYEKKQGVELSGKSRVEFTTKSKQRL